MGKRLTCIYTRTGDDGMTGIATGDRVAKDDVLIVAIGEVDELNSLLAVVKSHVPQQFVEPLEVIQNTLFNIGGELAMNDPSAVLVHQDDVNRLEHWLDQMNASLSPLEEFILPGGSTAASYCHLGRSVCRRAERSLVTLGRTASLNPELLRYINRLSDCLFVLARSVNAAQGFEETFWRKPSGKN